MDFLLQLIWAFLGSLGFALIFNVAERNAASGKKPNDAQKKCK